MGAKRTYVAAAEEEPADLIVPPVVVHAPGPVRWLLERTYCPLLSEDDTPRERLLKSFVFATLPLIAAPVANLILVLVTGSLHGGGRGSGGAPLPLAYVIEATGMLLVALAWASIYLHVRLTQRVSEASADLVNAVVWVGLLLLALTNSDVPHGYAMICGMNFSLIALTPRTPLFVFMFVLTYLLACYNTTAARSADASGGGGNASLPLLMVPDHVSRGVEIHLLFSGMYLLPILGVAIGLVLRMASADQMSRQADASARLAAVIARALAQYDTKAAATALQAATQDGDASPELVEQFGTLIANLNTYRPHLPNWVIADGDSTDAGVESDMDSIVVDPDDDDPLRRSGGHRRGSHCSDSRTSHISTPASQDRALAVGTTADGHLHQRATVATVCLAAVDVGYPQQIEPEHQHALVDRVHELAARTYGAVHSFVGDRVTVSWNAASRVANPQAKAARFLVQLAASANDRGASPFGKSTVLSGAAISGKAAVLVAGLGDQRALTVHMLKGDTVRRLDALCAEAQIQGGGVMLCDEQTKREAEHLVRLDLRACVVVPQPHTTEAVERRGHRRALGYALHGLVDDAAANDEWMYVLEAAARKLQPGEEEDQPGQPAVDPEKLSALRVRIEAVEHSVQRWALHRTDDDEVREASQAQADSQTTTSSLVASLTALGDIGQGAAGRIGHLVRSLKRCAAVAEVRSS